MSDADLDALARDPRILSALGSSELQSILRRIDAGGGDPSAAASASVPVSDQARIELLERYRNSNSDFEAFMQNVLSIINKEEA